MVTYGRDGIAGHVDRDPPNAAVASRESARLRAVHYQSASARPLQFDPLSLRVGTHDAPRVVSNPRNKLTRRGQRERMQGTMSAIC